MSCRLLLISGREVRPCLTLCPAGFNFKINTHKLSYKENKNDHWYLPVLNWEKYLTGTQNVQQTAEGMLDIWSGTPNNFRDH